MPLLRGIARTAVVAGTATSVSNRVSRRQAQRWGAQEQARYDDPGPGDAPPPPQPAVQRDAARDPIQQLKDLAALKEQGILTEEEFAAQKARVLAG